jgi:hypothetical protein
MNLTSLLTVPNSGGCKHVEPQVQCQGCWNEVYSEQGDNGPRLLRFLTGSYKFVSFVCNHLTYTR